MSSTGRTGTDRQKSSCRLSEDVATTQALHVIAWPHAARKLANIGEHPHRKRYWVAPAAVGGAVLCLSPSDCRTDRAGAQSSQRPWAAPIAVLPRAPSIPTTAPRSNVTEALQTRALRTWAGVGAAAGAGALEAAERHVPAARGTYLWPCRPSCWPTRSQFPADGHARAAW